MKTVALTASALLIGMSMGMGTAFADSDHSVTASQPTVAVDPLFTASTDTSDDHAKQLSIQNSKSNGDRDVWENHYRNGH